MLFNLHLLTYYANALIIMGTILGLALLFMKRLGTNMYPIVLAVTVGLIEEQTAHYFAITYKTNSPVYFFFNPFEYACFAWFFFVNIDYKFFKKAIVVSVILFFSFILGYYYFFLKLNVLQQTVLLDYVVAIKGILLTIWPIVYIVNIFDQIGNYKKLNVYVLLVAVATLFYSAFAIIYRLSEIYLFNYAARHNVPLEVLFSPKNMNLYASKQYEAVRPLLVLTNILLYLCIFVALIKSATTSKKAYI